MHEDQSTSKPTRGDDFVGVQAYTRTRIGRDAAAHRTRTRASRSSSRWATSSGRSRSRRRSATRPTSPADPVYVTENGIGHDDDATRIKYVHRGARRARPLPRRRPRRARLLLLVAARQLRVGRGLRPRFGLVAVDRDTFVRTPKPSRRLARRHRPGQPAGLQHLTIASQFPHTKLTFDPASGCDDGRHMERGTILVVDDEPNIADLVELYLRRDGFRVVKAATGEDGVRRRRRPPAPPRRARRRPPRHRRPRGVPPAPPDVDDPGHLPHRARQRDRPRARASSSAPTTT